MTFQTQASEFAERVVFRGPDLESIWSADVGPEGDSLRWNLVAKKAGRYLVAISSVGDGGGGSYSLSRQVFHAREFAKDMPAQGKLQKGKTEVWRFRAKPDEPLLVHWFFSSQSASVAVYDEMGEPVYLPRTEIDGQNSYGILKVSAPTTFLVVVSPFGDQADYRIGLQTLPGYVKGTEAQLRNLAVLTQKL